MTHQHKGRLYTGYVQQLSQVTNDFISRLWLSSR